MSPARLPRSLPGFLSAKKAGYPQVDRGGEKCYTPEWGDEGAGADASAPALPFVVSTGGGIREERAVELEEKPVRGKSVTPILSHLEADERCRRLWLLLSERLWPLQSGHEPSEVEHLLNSEVAHLELLLDQQLRSGASGSDLRRSELGSQLAHAMALAAAYSEQRALDGGHSHHDHE